MTVTIRTVAVEEGAMVVPLPDGLTREQAVDMAKLYENKYRRERFKTTIEIEGLPPDIKADFSDQLAHEAEKILG